MRYSQSGAGIESYLPKEILCLYFYPFPRMRNFCSWSTTALIPAWLGSETYYTQLRLDPLPSASAEAVLDALLRQAPGLALLKRVLIARIEGSPFFLGAYILWLRPGSWGRTSRLSPDSKPANHTA
jgi:hypothetical protein